VSDPADSDPPILTPTPFRPPVERVPARPGVDALDAFLQEARRFPRLSAEEENELARKVFSEGDRDAAKRLVLHHLWLVVAVAKEYRRATTDLLDLLQEGSLGLLEAVKRFDPFQGTRFATYARYWVRAYILRHLLGNEKIADFGRTRAGRTLFFRLQKERQALEASGLDVTPKLLEDRMGLEEGELARVRPLLANKVSLDRPLTSDTTETLAETIADRGAATPASNVADAEFQRTLKDLLDAFRRTLTDPREIAVWDEHLVAETPVTLSTLGERWGVSKQRVGQLADRLKRRCREFLVRELGPETQLGWIFEES
jgi:RNA polymerase sigma-32 factor